MLATVFLLTTIKPAMKFVALLLISLFYSYSFAQRPENLFIVVIDGLRDEEGFAAESLYLRHIWNDLRPLGAINTRFFNRGWTATTSGHLAILSGDYVFLPGNGGIPQELRSDKPLLFEYARAYLNLPESAVGVVYGKWGNVGAIADFSLMPGFGGRFRGFSFGNQDVPDDTLCSKMLHRIMDSIHPRMVMVNLADVDYRGHSGVYQDYLQAIRVADSIVYELYKHIQALPPYNDTFYRNRTLLIVTSDHGRRDDAHGGFAEHAHWDHGSRHILFLALGTGIAAGRRVDTIARDLNDILPTVGYLFNLPTPFSSGKVMREILAGDLPAPSSLQPLLPLSSFTTNISLSPGYSTSPDVSSDRAGRLYCVWVDNSDGYWRVYLRTSNDEGTNWSPVQVLFPDAETKGELIYARVAADDSVVVSATGSFFHLQPVDSARIHYDSTFLWYPLLGTSTDGGQTWHSIAFFDSSMGSHWSPAGVRNGRYSVAWWQCGKFPWEETRDGINFNWRSSNQEWQSMPGNLNERVSSYLTLFDDGQSYHVAGSLLHSGDWDVIYLTSPDGRAWFSEWIIEDPAENPVYDYTPEIAVDDSGFVHIVWARRPNGNGNWRVVYGRRNPVTNEWDTVSLTPSSVDAWQPHISFSEGLLTVVWTDYRDGANVYLLTSDDRGRTWSVPFPISAAGGYVAQPRLCALGERRFYCVWSEWNGDNWEIVGQRVYLPRVIETGPDTGRSDLSLPTYHKGTGVITYHQHGRLVDISGRVVAELLPGPNHLGKLAAGVYIILPYQGQDRERLIIYR